MAYLKFLILSSPRSGTHMLRTALNNHPKIVCQSEMFNPDFIISEDYDVTASDDHILQNHIFKDYADGVDAVGFILHRSRARFGDWPDLWNKLEANKDIKIILLHRENLLRRYLSHQVMRAKRTGSDIVQKFTAFELANEFAEMQQELIDFTERFAGHSILKISYEDLCGDYCDTIGKVQNYLGLERRDIQPSTSKNTSVPLSEAISNYEKLRQKFSKTLWADYFREKPVSEDFKNELSKPTVVADGISARQLEYDFDFSVNSDTNTITIDQRSYDWNGQLRVDGRNNVIDIAANLSTRKSLTIRVHGNNNQLTIGSDVHFLRASVIRIVGDNNRISIAKFSSGFYQLVIEGDECEYNINESVTALGLEIRANQSSSVSIGRDCAFQSGVVIVAAEPYGLYQKGTGKRLNQPSEIIIGNHVWCGRDVYISSGVKIGSGSKVEPRSLLPVNGQFPTDTLVGGHPATIVQHGIAWTRDIYTNLPEEYAIDWDKNQ